MKIKKSKFAKLLALMLPIAAISVVTPVVLTSCGSSTSNGGSSGDSTQTYDASWDTSKAQDGLTFDTTNNSSSAVITLKSGSNFAGTTISKSSKFDDIKKSLDPATTGTSLYSVLSGAIKNINNYIVSLSVDTNPVNFDYTNDSVGNYFEGQYQLTPKKSGESTVNLKFRVNNFNDSYNGTTGEDLKWNVEAIKKSLESANSGGSGTGTGNKLPDVEPSDNGSSVTINLTGKSEVKGLGQVMDELCKSTITSSQLNEFISKGSDSSNYDLSKATISSWAPSVDGTTVFTRIVVPSTSNGRNAILYIAYTGFKNDDGNAVWNRNILYPGSDDKTGNKWDSKWKEPIIDLSKVSENIGSSNISSNSTLDDIKNTENMKPVVDYMVNNYIMDSKNFNYCFSNDSAAGQGEAIVQGSFDNNWEFTKNTTTKENSETTGDSTNNKTNAVEFKIFFMPKTSTSASTEKVSDTSGIWRSFYIINYKNSGTTTK